MTLKCIFCRIVNGDADASTVYEDDRVMAFMTRRPARRGEFLVIPKQHFDHLTDVPEELASQIFRVAHKYARHARERLQPAPLRMGMIVHGFGVPHAHLIVVPQHDANDITSGRFASVENGQVVFSDNSIPMEKRHDLDAIAELLASD